MKKISIIIPYLNEEEALPVYYQKRSAVMDADLQNPPKLLPQMYRVVTEGGDKCVAAKRLTRIVLTFLLLAALSLFFCWFFVGRYGIFGSKVDWLSQHSVLPDYFRRQFYETGDFFPEYAANIGGDRTFTIFLTMGYIVR